MVARVIWEMLVNQEHKYKIMHASTAWAVTHDLFSSL